MRSVLHHLDAFTTRPLGGNPAAVIVLSAWPSDALLGAVAAEMNLSVTAFLVDTRHSLELRLFTPTAEIGPAGHATLAAARVALDNLRPCESATTFTLRNFEPLTARRDGDRIALDYPSMPGVGCEPPAALVRGLGLTPDQVIVAPFGYLAVVETPATVRGLSPEMTELLQLDRGSAIGTAPGLDCDFVSRVFSPKLGLPEDPVCGTAHRIMVPYWAERLGKSDLKARQISVRGGDFWCHSEADRTILSGHSVELFRSELDIPI